MKNLATKLKILRDFKGYKQAYVGHAIGLSQSAYSRIESGNTENIPLQTLKKLADLYELRPEQLLGWDGNLNFTSPPPPRSRQKNA